MTKVILTGDAQVLAEVLRDMRAPAPLTVTAHPTHLASALDQVRERGHRVVEDLRVDRRIMLELAPRDIARLRLLKASDYSHVLASARRLIHAHLDELIMVPACDGCDVCIRLSADDEAA